MKKILVMILFAAAVLSAGCDTIETKTIKISLGGDKATTAPPDVTRAYIAVWTLTWNGESHEYDRLVYSKSVPAAGYAAAVVPAGRDLYIMVIATNDAADPVTTMYTGDGNYYGESGGEEELPEFVYISMDEQNIESMGTTVTHEANNDTYEVAWGYETFSLGYYLANRIQIQIERAVNSDVETEPESSYRVIYSTSFYDFQYGDSFVYEDTLDSPLNVGEVVWYRVNFYIPAFKMEIPAGGFGTAEYEDIP